MLTRLFRKLAASMKRKFKSLEEGSGRHPALEWLIDVLFGDDIFISYSRQDGTKYAEHLANRLSAEHGLSCRVDLWDTLPGKRMPKKLLRALWRSRVLVVVASKSAAGSTNVGREIRFYMRTHTGAVSIIPVDFDGGVVGSTWFKRIEGLPPGPREEWAALDSAKPSDDAVRRVSESFNFTRRNRRLFYTSAISLVVLLSMFALSVGAGAAAGVSYVVANVAQAEAAAALQEAKVRGELADEAGRDSVNKKAYADASTVYAQLQTLNADAAAFEAQRQAGLAKAADKRRAAADRATADARELERQARANAAEQQSIADSRRLAGQADRALAEMPDLSLLLGAAAYEARKEQPTWEARRSLLTALGTYQNLDYLLYPPGGGYTGMAVAPDARTLITTSGGGLVFWDVESKRPRSNQTVEGLVNGLVLTPDNKTLAMVESGRLIIWDVKSETRRGVADPWRTDDKFGYYSIVAAAPDNKTVATNGKTGEVILWDISDHDHPRQLTPRLRVNPQDSFIARCLAFSPDGKTLLAGGSVSNSMLQVKGSIMRWDITDPRAPKSLPELTGVGREVYTVTFSPDGRRMVSVDAASEVHVWSADSPEHWNAPTVESRVLPEKLSSDSLRYPSFSRDGKLMSLVSSDGPIVVYDAAHLSDEYVPRPRWIGRYARGIDGAIFDYDTRYIVSFDADGTLGFWRLDEHPAPELARELGGHEGDVLSTAYAPGGGLLASGDEAGRINLDEPLKGSAPRTLLSAAHNSPVLGLDFDPSRRALASGYGDGGLALWSQDAGGNWNEEEFPVGDIPDASPDAPGHLVNNTSLNRLVWFVHFAEEGRTLISIGPGSQVVFWDARERLHRHRRVVPLPPLRGLPVFSAAATPNGRMLAVGYGDGTVRLLDTEDTRGAWVTLETGRDGWVRNVAFGRGGRLLASTDEGGGGVIWQMGARPKACRSFEVSLEFPGTTDFSKITSIAFDPDGETLALGSSGNVVLLDVDTGSTLGSLDTGLDNVGSISFSPHGEGLAAGGHRAVSLLDLRPATWAARAGRVSNRGLSAREAQQFVGVGGDCGLRPAGARGRTHTSH